MPIAMHAEKPKIVVSDLMPPPVMAALAADYDFAAPDADQPLGADGLISAARDGDGDGNGDGDGAVAFCPVFFPGVSAEFIGALPASVRIIASFGVGTDHIDLDAARAQGMVVTNTPDVLCDDAADLAFGLMLATARRFHEGETMVRQGRWQGSRAIGFLGHRVSGKTLGIIGLGGIGRALAKRARAFDMPVIYHSRSRKPDAEAELGVLWRDNVDALLQEADFVSLNAALTPDTRHIIDARRLRLMKPGAYLINTGRGPLVDEQALVAALKAGEIAGAGLDVYEREPELAAGLTALANVTLLPHVASATHETREAMGFRVKANLDAFFAGQDPPDRVV